MNWIRFLVPAALAILVACGGSESVAQPQVVEEEPATLTPSPTATVLPEEEVAREDASGIGRAFYRAWEGQDYLGMYSLLAPQVQVLVDSQSFVQLYDETMETATVKSISAQPLSIIQEDDQAEFGVRVTWETNVVGSFSRDYIVSMRYEQGRWGILWD
jgi:hypothetical protein